MKILLIEDNLSIQKGLLYSLKQNQYEVLISSSCKEALNLLKENEFSLIILDVSLLSTVVKQGGERSARPQKNMGKWGRGPQDMVRFRLK